LELLDEKFKDGEIVSPSSLIEKGIVRMIKGRKPLVKILGNGKLTKKLSFEGVTASKSAKEAIEKAGGNISNLKFKSQISKS